MIELTVHLATGIYWITANPFLLEFAKEKLQKWLGCYQEEVEDDVDDDLNHPTANVYMG